MFGESVWLSSGTDRLSKAGITTERKGCARNMKHNFQTRLPWNIIE